MSFRYAKSFRHFVGTEEQHHRFEEGTQVINHLYVADLGLTYGLSNRSSLSVNIPFVVGERSQAISVGGMQTGDRNETSARGIGDMRVTARRWMLNPETSPDTNVQLGLGVKLPTGAPNETAVFRVDNGAGGTTNVVRSVDQSIQPGDGGFGFIAEVNSFTRLGQVTPYLSASYLFNPSGNNGVQTFRSRPTESLMSIADQYAARAGLQWSAPGHEQWSIGLGGRIDGVPVHDLIGGSNDFRRPGYSVSVEPSLTYVRGRHAFSLSVPWAVQRNREKSVSDRMVGGHGDAAFSDWMLLFSWSSRF